MSGNNSVSVSVAFEFLLDAIETEMEVIDQVGAEAFEGRDYESVRETLERAGQIKAFRERIVALREEWETLAEARVQSTLVEEAFVSEQGFLSRLPRGLRAPEQAFYRPILQILNELGGSAKASDVLERLMPIMKETLKEVDYQLLRSGEIRWRKSANWARNTLVKKGLLKWDSPHSIWEISELGVAWLLQGENRK